VASSVDLSEALIRQAKRAKVTGDEITPREFRGGFGDKLNVTMKRMLRSFGVISAMCLALATAHASLVGPWFRYDCQDLGFQMLVATGWKMTRVPNGIVFAMQYQPDPYVRVAVGRIPLGHNSLEALAGGARQLNSPNQVKHCKIDNHDAVRVETAGSDGSHMDYYVSRGKYAYWIGFAADRPDQWARYAQTFSIVVDGFHFL
jgi:hypothetical protein